MSIRKGLLPSVSVPNGHSDKLADRIADAALENEVGVSNPISVEVVYIESVESRALSLSRWVSLPEKPIGGRVRYQNYTRGVLPGLLPLCEKFPNEIVEWLVNNGKQSDVIAVLEHLQREVNIEDLERCIKNKRYGGPFPAPQMMMATDQYILSVAQSFIEAADRSGIKVRPAKAAPKKQAEVLATKDQNAIAEKVELTPALPPPAQTQIKHTDVFNGAMVRMRYRSKVERYGQAFATEVKVSFIGNMLTSRQVTYSIFPDGCIGHDAGRWGLRATMDVSDASLRAKILQHLGVDLSKSRLYREFSLPK